MTNLWSRTGLRAAALVMVAAMLALLGLSACMTDDPSGVTQRTARRVDRLSFFNVAVDGNASAKITLHGDPQANEPWLDTKEFEMVAGRPQPAARILDRAFTDPGPKSVRCRVQFGDNQSLTCLIRVSSEDLWLVAAEFWLARKQVDGKDGEVWLCGEILQSDGSVVTHEVTTHD